MIHNILPISQVLVGGTIEEDQENDLGSDSILREIVQVGSFPEKEDDVPSRIVGNDEPDFDQQPQVIIKHEPEQSAPLLLLCNDVAPPMISIIPPFPRNPNPTINLLGLDKVSRVFSIPSLLSEEERT